MRSEGADAEAAVDSVVEKETTTTTSRLGAVAAGTRGSRRHDSATTWTPALRWELKVLCEWV